MTDTKLSEGKESLLCFISVVCNVGKLTSTSESCSSANYLLIFTQYVEFNGLQNIIIPHLIWAELIP